MNNYKSYNLILHLNHDNDCVYLNDKKNINVLLTNKSGHKYIVNNEIDVRIILFDNNITKLYVGNFEIVNYNLYFIYYDFFGYETTISREFLIKRLNRKNTSKPNNTTQRLIDPYETLIKYNKLPKTLKLSTNLWYITLFILLITLDPDYITVLSKKALKFLKDEPLRIHQNKKLVNLIAQSTFESVFFINENLKGIPKFMKTFFLLFYTVNILKKIVLRLHRKLAQILFELFDIFMSRNYNKLKNRIDRIEFHYDRAILGSLMMSIALCLLYNTFIYVTMFIFVHFAHEAFKALVLFLEILCCELSDLRKNISLKLDDKEHNIFHVSSKSLNIYDRIAFAFYVAFKVSPFSKPKTIVRILGGNFE
ncbi:hypothetical protein EDEG_01195 [Edhazardia aedis USNM 41457]|uniref:Uncharacterized protein n=1 Tax=Edhazardia aedis (strain USNM 41457) TaxID=1003232 RepID=J9DA60_EDHAE|nr:hypothetical protein EDEG_01195 [Edhazardia aedis USNM 41457]|eukprot:EJW04611.1 hypothetical protein EDEG_01195 [Edhazardia aedis USNM 41457]